MLVLLLGTGLALGQACPGDCDGDGWTVADGDCNDGNPDVHPGMAESCATEVDDDCDRLINEGCERDVQWGELGGGSCGGERLMVVGLVLPIGLFRRRC